MRLSRWKYDRSIKAGQTIGLETSRTGLETDWKKKKGSVVAATKPRGNIPYGNAPEKTILS